MALCVYKCNSTGKPHQVASGDWSEFFERPGDGEWGSTEWVAELAKAQPGDTVLAYQTNRNELVGVAEVIEQRTRGIHLDLVLRPVERLGVRVRPLKKADQAIDRIPALQPGPIRTLYEITADDARRLLRAAGSSRFSGISAAADESDAAVRGAGFGSADENKKIEAAAMAFVAVHLRKLGWTVRDVSATNCGYDLSCRRRDALLHVEVKGVRGAEQKFILTRNEERTWQSDSAYCLALVTCALDSPKLHCFEGPKALAGVRREVIAYVCVPGSTMLLD